MQQVEYLTVSVDALRKNTFNSNRVSAANEKKIRTSIERNGIFKPVIVRTIPGFPGFEIIGGEHRWEQAVELGYETVPIANLGDISDIKAKEISVIDNARYGSDDTIMFADILRDIGDIEEVSHFLPYGDADLSAIFAASNIALDDLENVPDLLETEDPVEKKRSEADKTHTVMRFKVSLGDAERLVALIASTQKAQGLTTSDDMTNAGDALVHLLSSHMATPTATMPDDWDDILSEIESERGDAE